jgi:NDP-sugar pyrophosphorylase family protein
MGRARLLLWALTAMVRSLSLDKYRILGKMNVVGHGCDIHPSAVVEGSVLGPGCFVGPHARVRFSQLGAGVVMQPGSQAEFAVIGDRALVSQNCAVNFSVLYPESAASHYLVQLCVVGRRAVTVGGAFLLDTHFGGSVKVQLDGQIHDTGQRFLGTALGHDVRVGSGVWLPAGREIPNGYVLVRSPDDTPTKIADGLPQGVPLIVSGGKIVPW